MRFTDMVEQRTRELHEMRDRIRLEDEVRAAQAAPMDPEPARVVGRPATVPAGEDCGPTAWAA
jgi:hypothetical protein